MSDADRSSAGFSISSGELATEQETPPIRVLGSARFSCFPFLLRARRAKRSEWWFLKFQSDVGIGRACNRTGNTANSRLGFGAFFLLPFFFKKPKLAARGYKKRHT